MEEISKIERQKIDVFNYLNYRDFLTEFLAKKKEQRPGFSLRAFSRVCGFRSPNYISLILSARRNLTSKNIVTLAKACNLDRLQARYFKALVEWNQSRPEEKNHFFDELYRVQVVRSQTVLGQGQSAILGKWYYHVLREMVLLPDFKFDAAWISERLSNRIPAEEAERAMRLLIQIGMLKEVDGKLQQSDPIVTTTNDKKSELIQQFHMDMIPQAIASLRSNEVEDRDFRGMTMAISSESVSQIKKEIKALEEKIIQIASKEQVPEEVYQLNLQLFHLTKKNSAARRESKVK